MAERELDALEPPLFERSEDVRSPAPEQFADPQREDDDPREFFDESTPAEPAERSSSPAAELPTVKFFYFGEPDVEWAFSAEPRRLEEHFATHPQSQQLYEAVVAAVASRPGAEDAARQMTRWIENERARFESSRQEPARMRIAEGIVAYLRAYDFDIAQLVETLKRRSGAEEIELAAVHLQDEQGDSTFKLKVVLVEPEIDVDGQGFNVQLDSPRVSYAAAAYALGLALYEVQELRYAAPEEPDSASDEPPVEPLPAPGI